MPSHKISSSKRNRRNSFFSLALLPLLLLGGCTAIDETKNIFDIPLSSEYRPVISREENFVPKRVLVLPVTGNTEENYRQFFEAELLNSLRNPNYWTIVTYESTSASSGRFAVDRFSAYRRAKAVEADALLFVELSDHSPYQPISVTARVVMERADTQASVLNAKFDYDTRNQNVADSARRYFQHKRSRTFGGSDAPDKSLYILSNNEPFLKFAGHHTGRMLAEPYVPAPPKIDSTTPKK
jgi:hypothetical protein